jgi:hypothetical protein
LQFRVPADRLDRFLTAFSVVSHASAYRGAPPSGARVIGMRSQSSRFRARRDGATVVVIAFLACAYGCPSTANASCAARSYATSVAPGIDALLMLPGMIEAAVPGSGVPEQAPFRPCSGIFCSGNSGNPAIPPTSVSLPTLRTDPWVCHRVASPARDENGTEMLLTERPTNRPLHTGPGVDRPPR